MLMSISKYSLVVVTFFVLIGSSCTTSQIKNAGHITERANPCLTKKQSSASYEIRPPFRQDSDLVEFNNLIQEVIGAYYSELNNISSKKKSSEGKIAYDPNIHFIFYYNIGRTDEGRYSNCLRSCWMQLSIISILTIPFLNKIECSMDVDVITSGSINRYHYTRRISYWVSIINVFKGGVRQRRQKAIIDMLHSFLLDLNNCR